MLPAKRRRPALVGGRHSRATLDVFLHEVGHAVFDYLDVPNTGREEDVADQFAAYLLLQFAKSDARRLILGVAYFTISTHQNRARRRTRSPTSTAFPPALLQQPVWLMGRMKAVRRPNREGIPA